MTKLTGKCLCGVIAYQVNGDIGPIVNCHCSRCRRWHGAAFRTRCTVKSQDFTWLSGEELLSKYQSSSEVTQTFCRICGSSLVSLYADKPDEIGLPLGGLDQDPGLRPLANIYVASKAPWYDITDECVQYEGEPPQDSAL